MCCDNLQENWCFRSQPGKRTGTVLVKYVRPDSKATFSVRVGKSALHVSIYG
jgi:hypothetical protein